MRDKKTEDANDDSVEIQCAVPDTADFVLVDKGHINEIRSGN